MYNKPKNHSFWVCFSRVNHWVPNEAIWFNTRKEARNHLKKSNLRMVYAPPIKVTKDY